MWGTGCCWSFLGLLSEAARAESHEFFRLTGALLFVRAIARPRCSPGYICTAVAEIVCPVSDTTTAYGRIINAITVGTLPVINVNGDARAQAERPDDPGHAEHHQQHEAYHRKVVHVHAGLYSLDVLQGAQLARYFRVLAKR